MNNIPDNKNYINREQDRRITWLEDHYSKFNDEVGNIKVDLAKVKKDVEWLKKHYWVIAGASIGAVIAGIFNILLKQ